MRAVDLDLRELLAFDPQGGILQFAGERALLFDAVALGLLRKELVTTLGPTAARALLTRFGYAHGWRTADTLRQAFPWDSEHDWRRAGGRLHQLRGLVRQSPSERAPDGQPKPIAETMWRDSYEAEQHLLHLGRSAEPVCWTLTGFASGYLTRAYGRDIYCLEERCRGMGDSGCQLVGRPADEWGAVFTPHLPFYRKTCLDAALTRVTDRLKRLERRLRVQRQVLGDDQLELAQAAGLLAHGTGMRRVLDLARRVASVDSTVLITGESGVGKERVARLIHETSPRAEGPFVALNCAAVAETLLEAELFGHVRGAFTGATHDRMGLFEAANGGSLLLDEIGDLSPALQAKLLRVLQQREVRRVGDNRTRPVDVRLLAATNRSLAAAIRAGHFRQDLYYRLRVVEIVVPPLRERREDILPLARLFLARLAERTGRRLVAFTPAAAQALLRYPWPGNVRELENAVERGVVLATGSRIDVDDLPEELTLADTQAAAPPGRLLADVERHHILTVLRAMGGNRTQTAKALGVAAATLYRKLATYGRGRRSGEPATGVRKPAMTARRPRRT